MEEVSSPQRPVARLGTARLQLPQGAQMPLFANRADWQAKDSWVRHALIMLHGRQRNADDYLDIATEAVRSTGSLVIAPQFITAADAAAHAAPPSLLRWEGAEWMGGNPALGPARVSGFTVLDELIAVLTNKTLFPVLKTIILAGHSGGGQVVQRYAILTSQNDITFIIANPSTYAYFSAERPDSAGGFSPAKDTEFPGFNRWKYGMEARPAYGADLSDAALEQRYIARDVTYVLGQVDCNPAHPALDRSPPAMAQGPHRLARGRAYAEYLRARHGEALSHRLIEIPGIGHDPAGIFSTALMRQIFFVHTPS